MADNDSEKTDIESQKKLEQSREKGELPKSQELGTFVLFSTFLIFFGMTRTAWFSGLGEMMAGMLRFNDHMDVTIDNVHELLMAPVFKTLLLVGPLFLVMLVIAPLATLIQTGFNLASKKFEPDWSKLNPISGIQRIVSMRQWIEGGKSTLKIVLFVLISYSAINAAIPKLAEANQTDLQGQIHVMLDLCFTIGIRIAVAMAILAVGDFAYQFFQFKKKLKMTHQEMKDENKEREGDPMIKQRQRSIAMQRARQRMMTEVPKADVIVTNPTHFAVALRYDKEKAPAPFVCAKGTEHMAFRIREIAKKHGIPIIENKPLARGLYKHCKVGQMVPNEFYKTVAEVLAFVFFLRKKKAGMLTGSQPLTLPGRTTRA
jgi:flagellar biosynthetic protein FlhB